MKHKFLTIGLPILGGLAIAGVGIASAAGMIGGGIGGPMMGFGGFGKVSAVSPSQWASDQTAQFQAEASALGLSKDVIVNGWAAGQSIEQIATANGISSSQYQTDMKNYEQSQLNANLQALVSAGTITQDQMNQYLQTLATQQANLQAKMQNASGTWKGFGGGFGRMGHRPTSTPATSN